MPSTTTATTFNNYIDGRWVPSASGETFENRNPANTDDLIGIFELTEPGGFANLAALEAFSLAFHEYGSYYIKQLGIESSDATLEAQGDALAANLGAKLGDFSPVRETMMWQKIQGAKGYLLVGMGDAHRQALKDRLDKAGIPHERVDEALVRQRDAIKAVWVP